MLLAQLTVVFAGVFLAFLLEEHREGREDEERRDQIYQLVADELEELVDGFDPEDCTSAWDSTVYRPFMEPYEQGEQPPLPVFVPPGSSFRGGGAWNALLATSGDVVEVELIRDIEDILDDLSASSAETHALRENTEALLIPHLDEPAAYFYDTDTGRLNQRYRWFPVRMNRIRRARGRYCERGLRVLHRLENALTTGRSYAQTASLPD